jgi:glycosyltransferase involved in cell wall biosynthesis
MADPLVSVCLPVYNGARFLEAAVQSVLAQTYPHFELQVFDDASTDGSWELLQGIRDPRITLHRNERNLGPEANWNQALAAARGKYIKLFHQDDLLAPECLEKQVRALEDHPAAVLAFCRRHIIRPDGRRLMTRGGPWGTGLVSASQAFRRCLLAGTNLIGEPSAVLFRSEAGKRIGGFDGSIPYLIDLDFWLRLMDAGDAWSIGEPLASFRISSGQWSAALSRRQSQAFSQFMMKVLASGQIGRAHV